MANGKKNLPIPAPPLGTTIQKNRVNTGCTHNDVMLACHELIVDPEFHELMPPLTAEEHRLLEDSIIANGCETPLFVWKGIVVDGHNRYDICKEHGIPFMVVEKEFANRSSVLMWIIQNQLGRRNLTAFQKCELALRFEPLLRAAAKERQRRKPANMVAAMQNASEEQCYGKTRDQLAKLAGVSHHTLTSVKKIAEAADDATIQKLRSGDMSIHKAMCDLNLREYSTKGKICIRCGTEKPISEFPATGGNDKAPAICKPCIAEIRANAMARISNPRKPAVTLPSCEIQLNKSNCKAAFGDDETRIVVEPTVSTIADLPVAKILYDCIAIIESGVGLCQTEPVPLNETHECVEALSALFDKASDDLALLRTFVLGSNADEKTMNGGLLV